MAVLKSKGTSIWGLPWVASRWIDRCSHPPTRILEVYIEDLPEFSGIYHPDGLCSTLVFQGSILGSDSGNGETKWTHILRTEEGVKSLWLLRSSSEVNWQPHPWWLSNIVITPIAFFNNLVISLIIHPADCLLGRTKSWCLILKVKKHIISLEEFTS